MNSIFISSSFMDFQSERDVIRSTVLPEINEYLRKNYSQETNIIDLRWGIDTSADADEYASMGKILETCLIEIQHCQPFMVALLGNRYGTVATKQQVQEHLSSCNEIDIPEDGIGVTELEIRYAMHLASKHRMNIQFYFRDMDYNSVPEHLMALFFDQVDATDKQRRLKSLKDDIRAQYGGHCRNYNAFWDEGKQCVDGLTDFSVMMVSDLKRCIAAELGAPHHCKRSVDRAFMQSNQKIFVGRQNELKRVTQFLACDNSNTCIVRGAPGSGKSAFLANIPLFINSERYDFVSVFCGQDQMSDTALDIITKITEGIYEITSDAPPVQAQTSLPAAWLRGEMENAIKRYLTRTSKTLVILIDGIDQLMQDVLSKKFYYLPQENSRVKAILSAPDEYAVDYSLPSLIHLEELPLEDPTSEDVSEIVHNIWHRHGKYSVSAEIEASLARKPLSKNYLYLNLIVTRLTFMGKEVFGSEKNSAQYINDTILRTIEEFPDTLEGAATEFIRVLGQTINPDLANIVFSYLRISHNGFRELDLQSLCGKYWNALDFSLIKKLLGSFLFERADHRIDFTHKVFRRIEKAEDSKIYVLCQKYCDYALALPFDDSQSVTYSVHSSLCSSNYSAFYQKICAWAGETDALQRAAEELTALLCDNRTADINELIQHFPANPLQEEALNFFTDCLSPLLPAGKSTIALFKGISDRVYEEEFRFLNVHQQLKICDFEYARYVLEKEYSDDIEAVLVRLNEYLSAVMVRVPNVLNCGRYMDLVLLNPNLVLLPRYGIDECISLIANDQSDEAMYLKAKAEIIRADAEYPKALFQLNENAEKHIDCAVALIEEIAGKALNQKSQTNRKKCASMVAGTYKMIGDIYLRVDNASGKASIDAKHTFYGNAEYFYKTSVQAFTIYASELERREMECFIEAAIGLATVCIRWISDGETKAGIQKNVQNLIEEIERRIFIVTQSQSLSVLYANLCGMMSDMFGIPYDKPPFERIASAEDGFRKVKNVEKLDYWSSKQISLHQNIVRSNSSPNYVRKLCQAIISRIKALNWYGYRSKETIELQFKNPYGIDFESLQNQFRHAENFERDISAVRWRIFNPIEFDAESFAEQLDRYRQSLSDDEIRLTEKKVCAVFDLLEALEMLMPEDPDYAHSRYLYFGQKLMRLKKLYSFKMDTVKFIHMQEQLLLSIKYALSALQSLSWYVICRYPEISKWGFDDFVSSDQLSGLSREVENLYSLFPAYSHRDADSIYELDAINFGGWTRR